MANTVPRAEDVLPVHSRVSWSAVLAGAAVSTAVAYVLTLLGALGGFAVAANVRPETLTLWALIWAVFATLVALFVGGWVATRTAVGENTGEAVIHGILVWSTGFAIMLLLVAAGVESGFNAVVGMAYTAPVVASETGTTNWEDLARRAGATQEQIDEWRAKITGAPENARAAVDDPETREAARRAGTWITGWALGGSLLSMAAAIAGGLAGAGAPIRLFSEVWETTTTGTRTRGRQQQYAGKA